MVFDTVSINPAFYLPWMKTELLKEGVEFIRRKVNSLDELPQFTEAGSIVVNATGLGISAPQPFSTFTSREMDFTGSRSLHGVEDLALYPIRGQTIAVYAPEITEHLSEGIGASIVACD